MNHVIFVLGGPGSGKGTQCALIKENFGYIHLSAGDLLREEKESGSELAEMINTYIREGQIVPAAVTVSLLRRAMESHRTKRFLIDGFPRNLENLQAWNEIMGYEVFFQFLLFLDCPEDVMVQRVLERGKSSGRVDDNEDSIRKRLRTYQESTMPIIEYFASQGKTHQIDANREISVVFSDISRLFQTQVVFVLGGPGSGKGTQCQKLVERYGLVHLSAGDLLRAEQSSGSALADMINTYIKEGQIVPAAVTVELLLKAMRESGKFQFLIDGFPRNLENLEVWNTLTNSTHSVEGVLFFDCPEDVMTNRILERGKSSGRVDDNLEAIHKRFRTFRDSTMPIIEHFRNLDKLRTVVADREIDAVFQDSSFCVEEFFGK